MKVLFVHLGEYMSNGIPTGIASLSAILKAQGHEVRVFDTTFLKTAADLKEGYDADSGMVYKKTAYTLYDLTKDDPVVNHNEEFQKTIDAFQPNLIAVSAMTTVFDKGLRLFEGTNTHGATVIVGGVHATIAVEDCLAQEVIDIACMGEADEVLPELCRRLEAGKDPYDIPSMAFRLKDGSFKINPVAPRIMNLDGLPCPDWSLFDKRHLFRPYEGKVYSGSFFSSSRGCPMKCTYCIDETVAEMTGGHRGYFRTQSPQVTASHLRELGEKYDARWFKFVDDTFLLHPLRHLEELRDLIAPLGIMFGCSVMPNTITREKVALAKEMGCVAMSIGVESGNPEIRKRIKRPYSNDGLIEKMAILKDFDIRISTFNLIGIPGEYRENVFETVELNRQIKADASNVYVLFPYPGTPISREFNIPLRDENGRIPESRQATQYGLSNMSEKELIGLQKTFNLYLLLPKALWPVVRLAEMEGDVEEEMRSILSRVVHALPFEAAEHAGISFHELIGESFDNGDEKSTFYVPSLFSELWSLPLAVESRNTLRDAMVSMFYQGAKDQENSELISAQTQPGPAFMSGHPALQSTDQASLSGH